MFLNIEKYVKKQIFIAACLNVGHMLCGYAPTWSAPVIPKLQDPEQTPLTEVISATEASWVGSTVMIGCLIGPHISGSLSNIIGRKLCLVMAGCLYIAATIIILTSQNLFMIYSGRILVGFSAGTISVVNIIYIGETAAPNIRGIVFSSTGIFHSFGGLLMYSIGPYVSYLTVNLMLLVTGILYVLVTFLIPESPIYYILKGNTEGARKSFFDLGREKDLDEEIKKIGEKTEEQKLKSGYWKELYTIKSNRKSFIISFCLFFFQQWSGVFAATFFAVTIFRNADSSIEPALATLILGIAQLGGSLIVPFIIDKMGRKPLLLMSTASVCLNMAILSIYFYFEYIKISSISKIGWLPLATLVLSFFSFNIGLNIIPNTITGELFRPNVRGIGSSLSMTLGYITGFASITSFAYLVEAIGNYWTFAIFAIVNAAGFLFTLTYVPETKGLSLTEIEKILAK